MIYRAVHCNPMFLASRKAKKHSLSAGSCFMMRFFLATSRVFESQNTARKIHYVFPYVIETPVEVWENLK